MFQLLYPIALTAMAGILVPLAIHLWNSEQGKTLQIGSIALLQKEANSTRRQLKITQLLLLLLRCLLVLLLALLLAQPLWSGRKTGEKGWILLEPGTIPAVYQNFRPQVDTLLQQGYTLHYLQPAFPVATLADSSAYVNMAATVARPSLWALYHTLDRQLPATIPVSLFTTNRLARFSGNRPVTRRQLQWKTFTPADTAAEWIAAAYRTALDSIRVITGSSNSQGTRFAFTTLAAGHTSSRYHINSANGQPLVSLDQQPPVPADTSVLRVQVYSDALLPDGDYVRAAIGALADFTGYHIQVSSWQQNSGGNIDWLFWLSTTSLPHPCHARHVFLYDTGKMQQQPSRILASYTAEQIPLLRHTLAQQHSGIPIWKDGFGHPLLEWENKGSQQVYHFYSRFNPNWNNLPWSGSFPAWLLPLFRNDTAATATTTDLRSIDSIQLLPAPAGNTAAIAPLPHAVNNLSIYCWWLVLAAFAAERFVSFHQTQRRAHG